MSNSIAICMERIMVSSDESVEIYFIKWNNPCIELQYIWSGIKGKYVCIKLQFCCQVELTWYLRIIILFKLLSFTCSVHAVTPGYFEIMIIEKVKFRKLVRKIGGKEKSFKSATPFELKCADLGSYFFAEILL